MGGPSRFPFQLFATILALRFSRFLLRVKLKFVGVLVWKRLFLRSNLCRGRVVVFPTGWCPVCPKTVFSTAFASFQGLRKINRWHRISPRGHKRLFQRRRPPHFHERQAFVLGRLQQPVDPLHDFKQPLGWDVFFSDETTDQILRAANQFTQFLLGTCFRTHGLRKGTNVFQCFPRGRGARGGRRGGRRGRRGGGRGGGSSTATLLAAFDMVVQQCPHLAIVFANDVFAHQATRNRHGHFPLCFRFCLRFFFFFLLFQHCGASSSRVSWLLATAAFHRGAGTTERSRYSHSIIPTALFPKHYSQSMKACPKQRMFPKWRK